MDVDCIPWMLSCGNILLLSQMWPTFSPFQQISNHPTSSSRLCWLTAARSHHISTLKQLCGKQSATAWFFSPTEPLCHFCVCNGNQWTRQQGGLCNGEWRQSRAVASWWHAFQERSNNMWGLFARMCAGESELSFKQICAPRQTVRCQNMYRVHTNTWLLNLDGIKILTKCGFYFFF